MNDDDDEFIDLVRRQEGAVHLHQAQAAGVTRHMVEANVAARRWQRVHRSVYVTSTGPLQHMTRVWAALLRAGRDAVAGHQTAAHLHGFLDEPPDEVHVVLPADRHVRSPVDGVRLHYAHRLPDTRHPVRLPPMTRIDDTVLDLVDVASTAGDVAGWVTRAVGRRLTTPERLADRLGRRKKISWRPLMESMLVDVAEGAHSPLELRYVTAVERRHGLPAGRRQHRVAGRRVIWVDLDYDDYDARIELDGRIGHIEEGAFRDRRRDNRAARAGKTTLRYGHAEVFGDECAVASEVAAIVSQRGWNGRLRPCGPSCSAPST